MSKLWGSFYNLISLLNKKKCSRGVCFFPVYKPPSCRNVLGSGPQLLIWFLSSILVLTQNPFSDEQVVVAKGHYAACSARPE